MGHALEATHSPELASLVFVFLLVNLFRRELVQSFAFGFLAYVTASAGEQLCGEAGGAKAWGWQWGEVTEGTLGLEEKAWIRGASARMRAVATGLAESFHALLHNCIPDVWAPVLVLGEFPYRQEIVWLIGLAATAAAKEQGLSTALAG